MGPRFDCLVLYGKWIIKLGKSVLCEIEQGSKEAMIMPKTKVQLTTYIHTYIIG